MKASRLKILVGVCHNFECVCDQYITLIDKLLFAKKENIYYIIE